tara:strand:+ start:1224 stop:1520 length:297 start_codon:yes stop_codon:yes gene_type:complete
MILFLIMAVTILIVSTIVEGIKLRRERAEWTHGYQYTPPPHRLGRGKFIGVGLAKKVRDDANVFWVRYNTEDRCFYDLDGNKYLAREIKIKKNDTKSN